MKHRDSDSANWGAAQVEEPVHAFCWLPAMSSDSGGQRTNVVPVIAVTGLGMFQYIRRTALKNAVLWRILDDPSWLAPNCRHRNPYDTPWAVR